MVPERTTLAAVPVLVTVTVATEASPVSTRLSSWSRIVTTGWETKSIPDRAVSAEVVIASFTAAPWVRLICWVSVRSVAEKVRVY